MKPDRSERDDGLWALSIEDPRQIQQLRVENESLRKQLSIARRVALGEE